MSLIRRFLSIELYTLLVVAICFIVLEVEGQCVLPPTPENGKFRLGFKEINPRELLKEESIIKLSCDAGYYVEGAKFLLCRRSAWVQPIPKCIALPCSPPPSIENGYYTKSDYNSSAYHHGTTVTYKCDEGFELLGNPQLECTRTSRVRPVWKGELPTCERALENCDDPGTPPGAVRHGTCCEHGSALSYECRDGYDILGSNEIHCSDGKWNDTAPTCKRIFANCDDPGTPPDALRHGICCENGSTLHYKCNEGYNIIGSNEIQCLDGKWSDIRPTCMVQEPTEEPPIDESWETGPEFLENCNDPGISPDAKRYGTCCEHGSALSFLCRDGYDLIGSSKIHCSDGKWNDTIPICKIRELSTTETIEIDEENSCQVPTPHPNGKFFFRDVELKRKERIRHNGVIKFSCEPGFSLRGRRYLVCNRNNWMPRLIPTCRPRICPPPPQIQNGYIVKNEDNPIYSHGSVVTYQCSSKSFELQGSSKLVCDMSDYKDGRQAWQGRIPICKRVLYSCSDPGVPPDGKRHGKCCEHGSQLNFECDKGLDLEGSDKIQCVNGTWSDLRPNCTSSTVCCRPPAHVENGKIIGDRTECYLPWETFDIKCDEGFTIREGSTTTYCEEDGAWDQEIPTCEAPNCFFPEIPANGTIKEIDLIRGQKTLPYGYEINFQCKPGFRLDGASFRKCGPFGWTESLPKCELIRCPNPGIPDHGWRWGNSFEVDDRVIFGCQSGYYLIGSMQSRCLPNGRWSGEPARCTGPKDYCPNPGVPINGIKIGTSYREGDSVEFRCSPDHFLIGSPIRHCQPNKNWNGTQPECIGAKDFEMGSTLAIRLEETIRSIVPETPRNIVSDRGNLLDLSFSGLTIIYFVFDTSKSVGESNFKTSVEFAKALVEQIGVKSERIRVGAIAFSTDVKEEFTPLDYDNTKDVLDALSRIQYNEGGTAIVKALRYIREEMIPTINKQSENLLKKHVVFLLTDGKPNMAGDPMEETEKLKNLQVDIHCVGITGSLNMEKLYQMASEPSEEYVFIFDSYDRIKELIEAITKGSVDYGRCGIRSRLPKEAREKPQRAKRSTDGRGRVIGGTTVEKPWPWMAALFNTATSKFFCGGSLINNQWVLTAAHCFLDKKTAAIKEKDDIEIILGLTMQDNITHSENYKAERIIFHDNYDSKTFDNDVALIKLHRAVEFSRYIRPVCLPPPVETMPPESHFYQPNEDAFIVGWGYNKTMEHKEEVSINFQKNLKYARIPIQSHEKCSDFVIRAREFKTVKEDEKNNIQFTDAMFCAGTGQGNIDACKGDSGGPLLQSDSDENEWTQVGVVSWGMGCGQPNTYGFYTHVSYLRNWIDENVRKYGGKQE